MSEAVEANEVPLSEALIAWVNTFPGAVVTNLRDFQDGLTFWHLLHNIDPAYFGDGEFQNRAVDVETRHENC